MSGFGQSKPCPICSEPAEYKGIDRVDGYHFNCPRCDRFDITRRLLISLDSFVDEREDTYEFGEEDSRERANLSGWLRENSEKGVPIRLELSFFYKSGHNQDRIAFESAKAEVKTFRNRANKLLLAFERCTDFAGQRIGMRNKDGLSLDLSWEKFIALSWTKNFTELDEILTHLVDREFIKHYPSPDQPANNSLSSGSVAIAPKGWDQLDKLKESNQNSKLGFMAMPFGDSLKTAWNQGLRPGIKKAGYEAIIANEREHADYIMNDILAQIRKARFVVADLTYYNPNVYFEAGFAMGLGIPLICTMNEDWKKREEEKEEKKEKKKSSQPFDLAQYIQIWWKEDEWSKLTERLTNRIEALVGHGPVPDDDLTPS